MLDNSPFDGAVCDFLALMVVVVATCLDDSPHEFLWKRRISGFRVASDQRVRES